MFPFNHLKVLIIAVIVVVMSISAIAIAQSRDPMIEIMSILEKRSNQCIREITETRLAQDQCRILRESAQVIFEDNPERWLKEMAATGYINNKNVSIVIRSLKAYNNALRLMIDVRNSSKPRVSS